MCDLNKNSNFNQINHKNKSFNSFFTNNENILFFLFSDGASVMFLWPWLALMLGSRLTAPQMFTEEEVNTTWIFLNTNESTTDLISDSMEMKTTPTTVNVTWTTSMSNPQIYTNTSIMDTENQLEGKINCTWMVAKLYPKPFEILIPLFRYYKSDITCYLQSILT